MITSFTDIIPREYVPYERIIFCSNNLIQVRYLIEDKQFIPILIGKGSIPKIWLFSIGEGNNPYAIVEKNRSRFTSLSVDIDDDNKRISLILNHNQDRVTLLSLNYKDNTPIVDKLDLNPIGYNIVGDKNSLKINNQEFSRNSFQNMQAFIYLS